MAKATLDDLKARAECAIENEEDLAYDMAIDAGKEIGSVKHMRWFKRAVMRALTENYEEYAHLETVVAATPASAIGSAALSMAR